MLVAFDVDGTVDAAPTVYLSLMKALQAAGHRVVIVTGCSAPKVTQQDIDDKASYLQQLGLGEAYDELHVFPDPHMSDAKVQWLEREHADLLIDNKKQTAKKAPCLALVPWATRE